MMNRREFPERINLGVVGALGVVGSRFLSLADERGLPVNRLAAFDLPDAARSTVQFCGQDIPVQPLTPGAFADLDIALFAAGAGVSREHAPQAVREGCVVVDNSSHFRMLPDVPLVVPQVNAAHIARHAGIIANPNCCAGPASVVLGPLMAAFGIRRLVTSTYQAVSGAGKRGLDDLAATLAGRKAAFFAHPIAHNVIPQIDSFLADGSTGEEEKLSAEIRKILDAEIPISATCVRVPINNGHSMSINVEMSAPHDISDVVRVLQGAPGVVVMDTPRLGVYPTPLAASGQDQVLVGRLRRDASHDTAINMWISVDNLRKGAATNALEIVECLLRGV